MFDSHKIAMNNIYVGDTCWNKQELHVSSPAHALQMHQSAERIKF